MSNSGRAQTDRDGERDRMDSMFFKQLRFYSLVDHLRKREKERDDLQQWIDAYN